MSLEIILSIMKVILIVFLLFKFIPKSKVLEANVAFLITQAVTWLVGLMVSEFILIEYPVRMFSYSCKSNFLFEFFLLPAICALFVVNYPKNKSAFARFMYYFYFCTTLTICEIIEERYTDVLNYMNWTWYITWITLFFTFYIVKKYSQWFFKRITITIE